MYTIFLMFNNFLKEFLVLIVTLSFSNGVKDGNGNNIIKYFHSVKKSY